MVVKLSPWYRRCKICHPPSLIYDRGNSERIDRMQHGGRKVSRVWLWWIDDTSLPLPLPTPVFVHLGPALRCLFFLSARIKRRVWQVTLSRCMLTSFARVRAETMQLRAARRVASLGNWISSCERSMSVAISLSADVYRVHWTRRDGRASVGGLFVRGGSRFEQRTREGREMPRLDRRRGNWVAFDDEEESAFLLLRTNKTC